MCAFLLGCEGWPLFANLPDASIDLPDPVLRDVDEDATLGDDEPQDLGALALPTVVTVSGTVDSCGYDIDDLRYDWPDHPVDLDGDGVDDGVAALQGWYAGDVDLYQLTASSEGWLDVTLRWELAPPGDLNAPYQPSDEDGPWLDEADLDFVVFDGAGAAGESIVSDSGASRQHPERTEQLIHLAEGEAAMIAVACHHELPTDYTLDIALGLP